MHSSCNMEYDLFRLKRSMRVSMHQRQKGHGGHVSFKSEDNNSKSNNEKGN